MLRSSGTCGSLLAKCRRSRPRQSWSTSFLLFRFSQTITGPPVPYSCLNVAFVRNMRQSPCEMPPIPPSSELVYFFFVVQIQPDHHRAAGTVLLFECCVRQEHAAVSLRNAADPALVRVGLLLFCCSDSARPSPGRRYRTPV